MKQYHIILFFIVYAFNSCMMKYIFFYIPISFYKTPAADRFCFGVCGYYLIVTFLLYADP